MYLFASNTGFKRTGFKQTGLFAVLLMSSLSVCAESQEVTETPAGDLQRSDTQRQDAQSQDKQAATGMRQEFSFPDWPKRQQTARETVPPPPPGPYMSSALSDYSVKAPSFGRNPDNYEQQRSANRPRSSVVPMDMFSPDVPWPDNLRQAKHKHKHQSPNRWMPENGYQYVNTHKMAPRSNNQQPPVQVRQQNQKRQYRGTNNLPNMNMNGSRWMPSMGFAPNRPYSNAPGYNGSPYRNQGPRSNQPGPYRSAPDQSGSN